MIVIDEAFFSVFFFIFFVFFTKQNTRWITGWICEDERGWADSFICKTPLGLHSRYGDGF